MRVEVVYALPQQQDLVAVDLAPGASVADAVRASGLARRHPEIDPEQGPFSIFSRRCGPERILRPGDRVEILRPLKVDPKEARRQRARKRE
ncbi:MAG: RnfH family protein [Halofilum sp. (in: g-proteobacteria)]|nr:RnfH family protein [Halofilum sp. (in: g-proteobacteria)]